MLHISMHITHIVNVKTFKYVKKLNLIYVLLAVCSSRLLSQNGCFAPRRKIKPSPTLNFIGHKLLLDFFFVIFYLKKIKGGVFWAKKLVCCLSATPCHRGLNGIFLRIARNKVRVLEKSEL